MAQADGVAGGVGREARSPALLIAPPLVADREVVSPRDGEHGVIQHAVGPRRAGDELAEAAAAAEIHYRAQAGRTAHHGLVLPHVIRLGLRVNLPVEPVLP